MIIIVVHKWRQLKCCNSKPLFYAKELSSRWSCFTWPSPPSPQAWLDTTSWSYLIKFNIWWLKPFDIIKSHFTESVKCFWLVDCQHRWLSQSGRSTGLRPSWPSLSSQLSSMLSLPSWLSTWLVLTAWMENNDHSIVNTTLISSSSTSPACSHPPTLSTYSMPLTSIRLRSRFLCDYNGRITSAQIIWFQIMIANKKWLYFVFHYMIFGH